MDEDDIAVKYKCFNDSLSQLEWYFWLDGSSKIDIFRLDCELILEVAIRTYRDLFIVFI